MLPAFTTLHFLPIFVNTVIGFMFGWLWYSPLMFLKPWMAELKLTDTNHKPTPGKMASMLGGAFLLTALATIVLAMIINSHGIQGVLPGAKMGLLLGVGLVAARQSVHFIFEMRSLKYFLLVAGYDVVLLAIQGAILGVWR